MDDLKETKLSEEEEELLSYCKSGDLEKVENLIEKGVSIHISEKNWSCPIHLSCTFGHIEIVKRLCKLDEEQREVVDQDNWSPLICCADRGHLEIVKFLVENEVDLNHRTEFGETALHRSVRNGRVEVIQYLLKSGAKSEKNQEGKYPEDLCSNHSILEIFKKKSTSTIGSPKKHLSNTQPIPQIDGNNRKDENDGESELSQTSPSSLSNQKGNNSNSNNPKDVLLEKYKNKFISMLREKLVKNEKMGKVRSKIKNEFEKNRMNDTLMRNKTRKLDKLNSKFSNSKKMNTIRITELLDQIKEDEMIITAQHRELDEKEHFIRQVQEKSQEMENLYDEALMKEEREQRELKSHYENQISKILENNENEKQELKKKLSGMKKEIKNLKSTVTELSEEKKGILEKKVNEKDNIMMESEKKNKQLSEELIQKQKIVEDNENTIDSLRKDIENSKGVFEKEIALLEQKLMNRDKENLRLKENEEEIVSKKKEEMENQEKREIELKKLEMDIAVKFEEIRSKNTNLEDGSKELVRRNKELREKETNLVLLKKEIGEKIKKLEEKEQWLKERENKIIEKNRILNSKYMSQKLIESEKDENGELMDTIMSREEEEKLFVRNEKVKITKLKKEKEEILRMMRKDSNIDERETENNLLRLEAEKWKIMSRSLIQILCSHYKV